MKKIVPLLTRFFLAILVAGFVSCKEEAPETGGQASAETLNVFAGGDFEDLPTGLANRVNRFFSDLFEGNYAACMEHVSLEHRELDIADDEGATPNYLLERLVDHPAMFDEDAPFPMLHKQFPGVEPGTLLGSIKEAKVTDVAPIDEGGEKIYLVMGEFTTSDGKNGKFCLRLREEPGSKDPGAIENYFLYPSAVG